MSNILGINGMLNMIERDLERHFFMEGDLSINGS